MFAAAAVPPSGLRRAPKRGRHPGEPLGYCAEASVGVRNRKLWVTSCNVCVTLNSIFNNSRVCCRLKHSLRYNPDSKEERVSTCDVERSRSRCRGEGCSAACQFKPQIFGDRKPVYDGKKNIYTVTALPIGNERVWLRVMLDQCQGSGEGQSSSNVLKQLLLGRGPSSKPVGVCDQPSPHLREGGWARGGGPVPARWDCLSGTPGPSGEATRAHGHRLSVPGGHPASSSPVSQLPGFPGYSPVAEDLFLHMVWENLCFWNNDNLPPTPHRLPSNRRIL